MYIHMGIAWVGQQSPVGGTMNILNGGVVISVRLGHCDCLPHASKNVAVSLCMKPYYFIHK